MRLTIVILLLLAVGVLVTGCAYQPTPGVDDPPGFLLGLLHGAISPYSLMAGLFSEIRIYAYPNSGWLYDLGFMLGLLPWAFSAMSIGARAASKV